jgi:hypothetical protein
MSLPHRKCSTGVDIGQVHQLAMADCHCGTVFVTGNGHGTRVDFVGMSKKQMQGMLRCDVVIDGKRTEG